MKRHKLLALGLMCAFAFAFNNSAFAAARNNQPAAPEGTVELTPEEAAAAEQEERNLIEAAQAMRRSGLVQFNFKEMDLVKFVRFMSELLRENIIVPPNINAKITIISPRPSSLTEARQIMLSTLQMYGFSLQDMGSYSIVRQGGSSPSPTVGRGRGGPGYG
ncbi:MAG: hypothetical protein IJQ63_06930 [Synergistaceae bacterium]|nr:hypothetical protein [Synergistaceae bacterium]